MSGRADSEGVGLETLDLLVKFKMSRERAEQIKCRFGELSRDGSSVSYLDCVLFDAALATLGEEQAYYGFDDSEWREIVEKRERYEARYAEVKVIDITDSWCITGQIQRN